MVNYTIHSATKNNNKWSFSLLILSFYLHLRFIVLNQNIFRNLCLLFVFSIPFSSAGSVELSPNDLKIEFIKTVTSHLALPPEVVTLYANSLNESLQSSGSLLDGPQYIVLADRNPNIQLVMIFWGDGKNTWQLIGAAPVSTGLPGTFDHFLTPLGVFNHSLDNPDFRAEGTKNEFGFKGYGEKGLRVYDFGWVEEARGWGNGEKMMMRLQMHSTDPDLAENHLGVPRSKGCIRIPAAVNTFIDRYGLLDFDYDAGVEKGLNYWVLRKDRIPTSTPGRYLVVIQSHADTRPVWSPLPKHQK